MIIITRRSTRMLLTDTFITAVAWVIFFYQFTNGIVLLASQAQAGSITSTFFGIALDPTSETLILCAAVCGFNALLVVIWSLVHKGALDTDQDTADNISPDMLADHFSVSSQQLDEVQDSRVTIVYHSPNGGIDHFETDRSHHSESALPLSENAVQVA